MRALTWQGRENVSVETVPDPTVQEPTDAVVRITSTAICGSDLHLYGVLGMFLDAGDILGHEAMGVVEAVGERAGERLRVGDRVVVPFGIACGSCLMCRRGLQSQCETTQVREQGKGAALFGYTRLYGSVPGGQAQYLRVPQAHYGPVVVPDDGAPDERYLYLSDVLPTAWQAVQYADVPPGGTVAVLGLGPIGQMAARIARHRGASRVIGVDSVPERRAMAQRHGIDVLDAGSEDVAGALRDLTDGRGPDSVIDAVGMEAHGSPFAETTQRVVGMLPDALAAPMTEKAGADRLAALLTAIDAVRRGGTLSISGVYGGAKDPLPLMQMFDKQVTLRMGQANVRRWIDDLLPLVQDDADPLGVLDLRTHRVALEDAPAAYRTFQRKEDGCIKVVLDPAAPRAAAEVPA
ncbi:zinc-dependent alcohol dehydrogenase [Cellulomonas sp.]|uniref:zinc-dependent alcohol dehydrogenase n=1 Tax=Cellulomonas sp. TaxID=40001 RepID=UPI0025886583|nr:zinc-dependent alcohol dehydrogenase [Cellulomonas sp.]MCR6690164.1 glutathione-dependent formaldehyde dehydrogenase [Cellulomonas sp.]